ncbi:GNAT family N-acetyltransferase [Duganella violaceipulchra]|uniref:GNAT family N-acetyltransferase n=1 Tax=Duganella violaceipulchra TaxID=2849652 RepID=A0AA41KZG0_9BURK|nr:GNAT family N-acetyltransferase [Duganella violaceicalia]MBV6320426.1 GNAT family N-acetyltransferase [Duganella violaceicalia]MCP2012261.1 GNAT superfamily N-acetyltransferase [Duganella violaceicalia]
MITFAPLRTDAPALAQYGALFAACFPGASKFTPAYLQWLYAANPDGAAVGYDAWDGDTLAAHYVCIPVRVRLEGQQARMLLSLNTATHPAYQGQGLFTKLAQQTFDAGRAAGYDGVYGVANANSTPGFIRKLGFQLVRPLEARVGVGPVGHAAPARAPAPAFERLWSAASLAWRCANPDNPVQARRHRRRWQFHAAAVGPARAYAELELDPGLDAGAAPGGAAGAWSPLRLYIGLLPDEQRSFVGYPSIPRRLRPSPLNLIYRSLSGRVAALDPARIHFTFLDFDAY